MKEFHEGFPGYDEIVARAIIPVTALSGTPCGCTFRVIFRRVARPPVQIDPLLSRQRSPAGDAAQHPVLARFKL